MKTANLRAEPLPEHGEGREVQLGVAMGVSVMLLRIDLGLVVEEPIQNVGCVPFRALDRGAVEGRVVVGDEGVELQRVVAQAMAVRGLQGLPGKEVALAVARIVVPLLLVWTKSTNGILSRGSCARSRLGRQRAPACRRCG